MTDNGLLLQHVTDAAPELDSGVPLTFVELAAALADISKQAVESVVLGIDPDDYPLF